MDPAALRKVVDVWVEQYAELGSKPAINYVQIFENRGAMMGASNPHSALPDLVEPLPAQRSRQGTGVAAGVARAARRMPSLRLPETGAGRAPPRGGRERQLPDVVPFWAVWPFETAVVSKRAHAVDRPALGRRSATAWRTS